MKSTRRPRLFSKALADADTEKESSGTSMENNRQDAKQYKKQKKVIQNNPRTAEQKQVFDEATSRVEGNSEHNVTGMPDGLKQQMEQRSDMDLSDIRVHYDSDKPSHIGAAAYAQGNQIHIGAGEEKYLPHEVWHVVQQKQGRVKPTAKINNRLFLNDEDHLEKEADQVARNTSGAGDSTRSLTSGSEISKAGVLQPKWIDSSQNGARYEWDELLDGVKWYADEQGEMWYYVVKEGSEDYSKWQGIDKKESFKTWHQLRRAVHPAEYPDSHGEPVPDYLYKGVGTLRLFHDLKESHVPTGIRPGSATAIEIVNGSRKPTKLDDITLWFGDHSSSVAYCKKQKSSILLRFDVRGHLVLRSGIDYFTTIPVEWSRVTYMNNKGQWVALGKSLPKNAKDFSGNESESDDDE